MLEDQGIVLAPGVYDGLSARLVHAAGFRAAYATGGGIARSMGYPDLGLLAMSEVTDRLALIVEHAGVPVIADGDTGYGNALNVRRTVREFERAGVAALHLEDQLFPKRCGHYDDKGLIPTAEMGQKLRAARDAARDPDLVIIARTDAIAVEGYDAALDRAEAYLEAGAEMLFVEAPRTEAELAGIAERFRGRAPVMANMVEGGATPMTDAAQLERLGFSLVIFPGGTVRAFVKHLADYFANLKEHGTTAPFRDRMLDFKALQALLGTDEILARGKRYDAS
jgi:2-methylisocitrate lyase-like PEP mutase family enzyme